MQLTRMAFAQEIIIFVADSQGYADLHVNILVHLSSMNSSTLLVFIFIYTYLELKKSRKS